MKSRIMKSCYKPFAVSALGLACWISTATQGWSQTQVFVNPSAGWIGYMNWFDNNNGSPGNYVSGGTWGTADLQASFAANELTLAPNTNVYDPANSYWVNPDGSGAKWMDANFYVQNDALGGQTLTFSGKVLDNSLVSPYNSVAFIKDFNSSYAVVASQTADLVSGQPFTITLATIAGDHIQYGFETQGPDANPATVASLGAVTIAAVPEPSSLAFMGLALALPLYLQKFRRK